MAGHLRAAASAHQRAGGRHLSGRNREWGARHPGDAGRQLDGEAPVLHDFSLVESHLLAARAYLERLAPEDKFPAQIDDVEAAYRWLLEQGYDPSRIASTGDSIGGNYAANLALTLQRKKAPLPGAVLSISPWFDMELKNKSVDTNARNDKMLTRDLLRGFADSMLDGTGITVKDPRINLAYADPTGLPPMMIFYGEYELLVDDANHFFLGAGRVPEIDAAVSEMGAWLRSKIGLAVARA